MRRAAAAALLAAWLACAAADVTGAPPLPGARADGQTVCDISVRASAHPVIYGGRARRNPDGSLYPGDAVNYLFRYSGGRGCSDVRPAPLRAGGRVEVEWSGHSRGPGGPGPAGAPAHPVAARGAGAAWLGTDHYFRYAWDGIECGTRLYVRVYSCEKVGVRAVDGRPQFSAREDEGPSRGERRMMESWESVPGRGYEVKTTHDWHLVETGGGRAAAAAAAAAGGLEDPESAAAFMGMVKAACSGLRAGQGCVFGRAAVRTGAEGGRACLLGILEKERPYLFGPPGEMPWGGERTSQWLANPQLKRHVLEGGEWDPDRPVAEMTVDECGAWGGEPDGLALEAGGLQTVHKYGGRGGSHIHEAERVSREAALGIHIREAAPDVRFGRPAMTDADGFPSKNADSTYYVWDAPAIHVMPRLPFREERSGTIGFTVERVAAPPSSSEIFTGSCGAARCSMTAEGPGILPSTVRAVNGDRLDVFVPEDGGALGLHAVEYRVTVTNIGRPVGAPGGTAAAAPLHIVEYAPSYPHAFPYVALGSGEGRAATDRAHALAVQYAGSVGTGPDDDGLLHPGRRSKANGHSVRLAGVPAGGAVRMRLDGAEGMGAMLPGTPASVVRSLGGEPAAPGEGGAVGHSAGVVMFEEAGFGRLLFSRAGAVPEAGEFEARGGLHSVRFGGKENVTLVEYAHPHPAAYVSAHLNVTAVGAGGEIDPYTEISAALAPANATGATKLAPHMAAYLEGLGECLGSLSGAGGEWSAGTITGPGGAGWVELDGAKTGLALLRARPGAAAAARAACPAGSAVEYRGEAAAALGPWEAAAEVSCGGANLNAALLEGGHASVRSGSCAASRLALAPWAAPACAPGMAFAVKRNGTDAPFPSAEFAAMHAADMHGVGGAVSGNGSAAGWVNHSWVRPGPRAAALLGDAGGCPGSGRSSYMIAHGEMLALGAPPALMNLTVSVNGSPPAAAPLAHDAFSGNVTLHIFTGEARAEYSRSGPLLEVRVPDGFGRAAAAYLDGAEAGPVRCGAGRCILHDGSGSSGAELVGEWGGRVHVRMEGGGGAGGGSLDEHYIGVAERADRALPQIVLIALAALAAVGFSYAVRRRGEAA